MQKLKSVLLPLAGLLLALFTLTAGADWQVDMKPGVTPVSQEIYDLHSLTLKIVIAIGVLVIAGIFISIVRDRKSRGVTPATWHESLTVEVLWTVVPFIILIVLAVPAAKTLIKLEDSETDVDLTIKATGYQWMWSYEYVDDGVSAETDEEKIFFYSKLDDKSNEIRQLRSGISPEGFDEYLKDVDREMVIPVNKKVRLLTTAADVIHSWWIPDFGGKKDAIPGFVNSLWIRAEKTGVYRGNCAELCGKDHAFMPIVVRVVEEDEYRAWVAEQKGGNATAAVESENAAVVAQAQ